MAGIRLYIMGAPRIELDGKLVELDTRKAVALLAYLVVTGQVQRRDSLAALLWPEYDHSHAMGALRRTLSSIRKGLGEKILEITRETVSIPTSSPLWSDYTQFTDLLADANLSGDRSLEQCDRCLDSLSTAANLYRDHFLTGFSLKDSPPFDDWQIYQAEILRRELSDILEKLVRAFTLRGDLNRAKTYARRWLSVDPMQELAHRYLMQLYAWSGQRSAALRQYQDCVRILERELGVQPLEETTQLYQAIKENHLPARQSTAADGIPKILDSVRRESHTTDFSIKGTGQYPFVGRSYESSFLIKDYSQIVQNGRFAVLQGEAGIGKTRLAEEIIEHVRARGAVALTARCYQGETNLAYSPFAELLRSGVEQTDPERLREIPDGWLIEAARLTPELAQYISEIPRSYSLESPGAQARFFEGISQVLLSICTNRTPGIIFLDDLQWADEASIDLLTYFVRRLNGRPVYLLSTWRGEEIPNEHRLRQLVFEAQRAGSGRLLPLRPLTLDSITELVRSVFLEDSASFEELSKHLYFETDGNPFFIVEYLKAVENDQPGGLSEAWRIPGSVRDLLRSRLSHLHETAWQIIQTAAVMGRSFNFAVLRSASGRSEEETVEALEDLVQRGLVREIQSAEDHPGGRPFKPEYDFSHQWIRDMVYEETGLARRRILHRRVAESLVAHAREGRESDALAGVVAQHFRLANQPDEAASYFRRAGEYARSLYANMEAIAHFKAAIELGCPYPAGLHESIGDLLTLSGEYAEAYSSYQEAIDLYGGDSPAIAQVEHKLGIVYQRHGEWDLAEEHFLKALDCLGEGAVTGEAARVYADWSLSAYHRGQLNQAIDLARRSLAIAGEAGDRLALAQAYNILGILARSEEDYPLARSSLEQSLILAEALNEPGARAAALNNLALVYGSEGNLEKALELTQKALKLSSSQGDRHREAALHNNLADLYYQKGQSDAAMAHLKQAVTLFSEIDKSVLSSQTGARGGEVPLTERQYQPEIWKLSEW